jgi:hypothetical protein
MLSLGVGLKENSMPVQAKADNNVPWIGPRSRYSVLAASPSWLYHRMLSTALDGLAPTTVTLPAEEVDPVASGGFMEWKDLVTGGLFSALYHTKRAFILEGTDASAGVVFTIVRASDLTTPTRAFPTVFPARFSAGEIIKATGGTGPAFAGILVRSYEGKIL